MILPGNPILLRFLLLVASGWAAMQVIATFSSVLVLFFSAAILAVLLNVPVSRLSRWMPRPLAISLTVLTALAAAVSLLGLLGFQVVSQGGQMLTDLEAALRDPQIPFNLQLRALLQELDPERMVTMLRENLSESLGLLGGAVGNLLGAIFLVVLTIYMLVDNGRLWRSLIRLLPESHQHRVDASVRRNVLGFLRGQLTLVLFLTLSSLLVFTLMDVRFSLVLAIVVGVLDAIPGIGATLGILVVGLIVLITQGYGLTVGVVVASVLLQQIQDNLIQPRVMRHALQIHPLVLFFALFVGERIAGLLGLFIAIPITGMIVGWPREAVDS